MEQGVSPQAPWGRIFWAEGTASRKSCSGNGLHVTETAVGNQDPWARAGEPREGQGWEMRGGWGPGGESGESEAWEETPGISGGGGAVGM